MVKFYVPVIKETFVYKDPKATSYYKNGEFQQNGQDQ